MTQGVRLLSVMTQNNRFEEATLSVIAELNDAKKVNYPSPEIFGRVDALCPERSEQ